MKETRLAAIPLFSGLSKKQLAELGRHIDEVDVPEGKQLVHEGDSAYEFFAIEEGTARVTVGDREVRQLGPGDFFGEVALVDSDRRTASVTVTSPMKVFVMTGWEFRALQRDLPQVADAVRARIDELQEADAARG